MKVMIAAILSFGIWAYAIIAVIVLIACSFFALIGWAAITILTIFIPVNSAGFFSYAALGFAICIITAVFSRD